jgi:hypothetical protein
MVSFGLLSLCARSVKSPVFHGVTGSLPNATFNKPEMKQDLSLKETDQSIFKTFHLKTFQQRPLTQVTSDPGQAKLIDSTKNITSSNVSSTTASLTTAPSAGPSNSQPKVVFPFTYTPDVIMKNSAILHPEEVEHALEEILGKDFRKTPKEIELEKARAARLEAKRLKKLKKQKKRPKGDAPGKGVTETVKPSGTSVSAHFQGWA